MARIILVVFCGALVFIMVSRFAPSFIERYMGTQPERTAEATEEGASKDKAAAKKSTTSAKSRSAKSAVVSGTSSRSTTKTDPMASSPATADVIASPAATSPEASAGANALSDGLVRINKDNATLYSTNNYVGPVVGLLKKGAIVEPVFTLSSAGQDWTFVNARQEKLAGFVLNDNLVESKPAEQAKR